MMRHLRRQTEHEHAPRKRWYRRPVFMRANYRLPLWAPNVIGSGEDIPLDPRGLLVWHLIVGILVLGGAALIVLAFVTH